MRDKRIGVYNQNENKSCLLDIAIADVINLVDDKKMTAHQLQDFDFKSIPLETIQLNQCVDKFNDLGYVVYFRSDDYLVKNVATGNKKVVESDQELERYLVECFLAS